MAEYRRRKGISDTWHYCTNCSKWPTLNYESRTTRPASGELCNECRAKEGANNCKKR